MRRPSEQRREEARTARSWWSVASIAYPWDLHPNGPETLPPDGAHTTPIPHLELPEPGDVLAERYEIERLVARGGMACIFRARHVGLDITVAVKVLDPSVLKTSSSGAAVRFTREAQLASQLKHPGIVEIFDFGVTTAGLPYIVMEFLIGESLGRLLEREAPLPWPRARDYALQLLEALQVAHDAGMVHRDIKPENCFIVHELDLLKVLDFGIAKVIHQAQRLTADGNILGTPHYLSPEQARATDIDERTDVYAVGIMMHEMLCGSCPFEEGSALEIVAAHINAQPPPLVTKIDTTGLPAGLQSLLDRTMAKDPSARPANAQALAAAIRALDLATAAPQRPWGRWAVVGGLAVTFGVGIGGFAAWQSQRDDSPPATVSDASQVEARPIEPSRAPVPELEPVPEPEPAIERPAMPIARSDARPAPPEPVAEPPPSPTPASSRPKRPRKPKPPAARTAIRRAASSCKKFAPPGGVRLRVSAEIDASGKVGEVRVAPPYRDTPMGRCVAGAVAKAKAPAEHASSFSGTLQIGGSE